MSYADKVFVAMCQDILENGTSTEGELVRPHWEDGTSAYTIKKFGVVNRYDLSKEFPAITLRKTYIKSATDELLWIWQKKSNNIHDLKSHVWDEWADEDGSIGKAYGYQLGVKHQYKEGMMDQVDRVIYDLKHTPFSRRILTNIYVHQDLHEMNLYPCAYSMTFNVTQKKGDDRLTLNGILNQLNMLNVAIGLAMKIINIEIDIPLIITDGIFDGNANSPNKKNSKICINHDTPSKN